MGSADFRGTLLIHLTGKTKTSSGGSLLVLGRKLITHEFWF